MKNLINIAIGGIFIWLLILSYYSFFDNSKNTAIKTVFIDNYRVFNEYTFKKEQDTLLFKIEEEVAIQLDSITRELNSVRSKISEENQTEELLLEYNALKKEYSAARQKAENLIKSESTRLTNGVYKKLNHYIEEYGKENSIDLILGSDGSGTVMYVDSTINVTENVIKFVNDKYRSN
ncbi:MAG TPA: OmpH family outer membrane protein [Chitinophagaceae bacterium]|nr:OmpH family outer membrane protein [Chitinophagaceae bacterium]